MGFRRLTAVSLLQVAEALLHMQVRLGMLKADDVPSLQTAPAPVVVDGAIMLGKGAQLPLLVPPSVSMDRFVNCLRLFKSFFDTIAQCFRLSPINGGNSVYCHAVLR